MNEEADILMRKIAMIPGDGVGADVAVEAEKVLKAVVERSGLDLQVHRFDYGAQKFLDSGITLPDEQIDDFRQNYAAVLIQVVYFRNWSADDIFGLEIIYLGLGFIVKNDAAGFIRDDHTLVKRG